MKTTARRRIRLALLATSLVVVVGLIASWIVGSALVAPSPCIVGNPPPELNGTAFTVASKSGSLISGWHVHPNASKGVVVLLHGIKGSRLSMLDRARMLHRAGYASVMIDLQAHGESPGTAITVGHVEQHDVRAAVDYARSQYPDLPIGVIGVSLGGASALLASPLDVDALVLESVYPTIRDAIRNRVSARLGIFSPLPTFLLLVQLDYRLGISPSELRPIDRIADMDCPVYVVSGRLDQYTTEKETRKLFSKARQPKTLWLVDGASHVDLMRHDPELYRQRILGFMDTHLGAGVDSEGSASLALPNAILR
ncbi:MAG: alpha/beta fold hydrolase [Planctomycetota bacterium]